MLRSTSHILILACCARPALALGGICTAPGAGHGAGAGQQGRLRLRHPPPRMGLLGDLQSVAGNVKSTFDGVKAAYEDDVFVPVGFVRARHILFLASDEAQPKADALARRIAADEISFADAALRFSACPTRDLHGSLGTFPSLSRLRDGTLRGGGTPYDGQDTSLFDEIVFSPFTPVGKVITVATQWGVHLVLIEARGEPDGTVALAEQVAGETARLVAQATTRESSPKQDAPEARQKARAEGNGFGGSQAGAAGRQARRRKAGGKRKVG
jgi:hypothetical protein